MKKTEQAATPRMTMGELLDDVKTAVALGVSPNTLANWRATKRYPLPYVKVGRLVRYRLSDIEAFIASNLVTDL
ncbi:helix-turn-helix domain-containing protein [Paraburkholderia sp. UCT31]|uniref:helix-turn-helix domain-containing protein n=1 Tax=Paraburkholderia sp. UCT31 TaxID=2615209 RepID=UPI00223AF4AA|nr:helix-turn-helix domain-containing protein [Paraburkholderia sp. UCT31]MBC8737567.1 helix-turn-helix domain-containing protein [Paraburkholderia sp. UCT31]